MLGRELRVWGNEWIGWVRKRCDEEVDGHCRDCLHFECVHMLGLSWAFDVYVIEGAAACEGNAVLDTSAQMKPLSKVRQTGD